MRFVMFYHSLISDWNHGNAHFLRGVASELERHGHEVLVYEPADGWSLQNLIEDQGPGAIETFRRACPELTSVPYQLDELDLARVLAGADVVIVHEWNEPALVDRIAAHHRRNPGYTLFFHDTHHRTVSDPEAIARLDLAGYDGILAFGRSLADLYRARGFAGPVFTWHEAADEQRFYPRLRPLVPEADLVWIGNWGDGERAAELEEFLIGPVRRLGLRARAFGVRYPAAARAALAAAGIEYAGWLPNLSVPDVYARHAVTVHVPRRQYTATLAGIPTIRPFEALACGIPLVSAPWEDREHLFVAGRDYLTAHDGAEMERRLGWVLAHRAEAQAIAAAGRQRVLTAHTCRHRVGELFGFIDAVAERRAGAFPRELAS